MSEYIMEYLPDTTCIEHEEIVRCRDCKHYHEYQDLCERLQPGMLVMEPDGFCAWGERKVDD